MPPSQPKPALPNVLVIGVGNRFAGDDAAGLVVAERLSERSAGAFRVLEHSGEGADLMTCWGGADTVVLIDAVCAEPESRGEAGEGPGPAVHPGEVLCFDASVQRLPAVLFRHSTHAFGVVNAVELARTLKQLPRRVIVYAIGGANFAAGAELSEAVESRISSAVETILREVQSLCNESA